MLVTHRRHGGAKAAVVFVHGFSGDPAKTWGAFPGLLVAAPELCEWDVLSLGYTTRLGPDLIGLWRGDPDLRLLATHFITRLSLPPLRDYAALAVVAHSMGGLVVQRALLDDASSRGRLSHVFCFGTPSAGLVKAGRAGRWGPQVRDMAAGGRFISDLRQDWDEAFRAGRPFSFAALAGDMDRFVPASSSLDPFDAADQSVVLGDHLQMVKPHDARSLSVSFVVDRLVGRAAPAGPWNAARVAVETLQCQRAVDLLEPHAAELDDAHLVLLALALDETGRREDAVRVLREHAARGTDPLGVLAGRLKRSWQAHGRQADADEALELYRQGHEQATARDDAEQAAYHGINAAYLQLVHAGDAQGARALAQSVLARRSALPDDYWALATEGEAHLHDGRLDLALECFRAALTRDASPRQLASTYEQTAHLARRLLGEQAAAQIGSVFRPAVESADRPQRTAPTEP